MPQLYLDGNDWKLAHLLPSEPLWRKVWEEQWAPEKWPPSGFAIQAAVPGDVISDALEARLIPEPYRDLNSRCCEWLSERDWVYRKEFSLGEEWRSSLVRLRFDGVDYSCRVYLNGEFLGDHEGMFTPFEFPVSHLLRYDAPNQLTVIVRHMPPVDEVQGQVGYTREARVWKARFAYNWDWCTRLVPLGIWQSVMLLGTKEAWIEDVWARPLVDVASQRKTKARIEVHTRLAAQKTGLGPWRVQVGLEDPSGKVLAGQEQVVQLVTEASQQSCTFEVPDPKLWYPNGMGEQPLYRVRVQLFSPEGQISDSREVLCGLRSLRFIANENAAPDALPYTLEVNGRRTFVKGWNWVPIDHMYGRVQLERYTRLVDLAAHAHCNLLRVWGGGLLEREEFYDLCDRKGILLWQEFMHSSSGMQNAPPEDEAYLCYIDKQARSMVRQRRNHASLAIWCGGNELMHDDFTPLDDRHPALDRLKSVVRELDPDRLWLPTSASGPVAGAELKYAGTGKMHDVHGPWQYSDAEAYYGHYNTIDPLYHSEFGVEGATNLSTLRRFVSPEFEFPPDASNPVWVHHGSWWIHREKLEKLFGPLTDIETFVRASQWMQAEGLRYAIEANRRRKWHCSGVSPWQLNEAFPNTACTSAVDYLGMPKPAYWWVRRSYEPVHISLQYPRLAWKPGQKWQGELWVSNSLGAFVGCKWQARVFELSGKPLAAFEGKVDVADNSAALVSSLEMPLAQDAQLWLVFLTLSSASGEVLSKNDYVFSSSELPVQPLLEAPETTVEVSQSQGQLHLRNASQVPALFVCLEAETCAELLAQDNYFCLAPQEERCLSLASTARVSVHGWNTCQATIANL